MVDAIRIEDRESAFSKRLSTFALRNLYHPDLEEFLDDAFDAFSEKITLIINEIFLTKVICCLVFECIKPIAENIDTGENTNTVERKTLYFYCQSDIVDLDTDLLKWYHDNVVDILKKRFEDFEMNGSGWTVDKIKELIVEVNQFDPFCGGTYIALPKFLRDKKAIVNVENNDNECFKWAILSYLFPKTQNPNRVSHYVPYANALNFDGLQFPMSVSNISRFERLNPEFSIHVYGFDEKSKLINVIRLAKSMRRHHVNLLLLCESKYNQSETKWHYCWIKNFSRLMSSQISSNDHLMFFCFRCLQHFTSELNLKRHDEDCQQLNKCKIVMPEAGKNDIIEFCSLEKQLEVPFIIYADIESLLVKTNERLSKNGTINAFQEHEVYSIGYYLKCRYDNCLSKYKSYRGANCVEWFVTQLKQISGYLEPILNSTVPMNMTQEDFELFEAANVCHICKKDFTELEAKIRDHSHLTGKYRGAAHSSCNLQYQESKTVPVVFHNLSGYDSHFFIKKLAVGFAGDLTIIPINDQLYISFTKAVKNSKKNDWRKLFKYKFLDSFRFMASSLDKLSSYLPSEKKKVLKSVFVNLDEKRLALLERKGVFPYDYVDSWGKLKETCLPPKDAFYNRLSDSNISDDDYKFAMSVWQTFNIKTLGDYSDLYLQTDILLLADVFENFRDSCLHLYGLDPAHYYTAPGFSWDAMLKYTKVNIELLTDIEMLLFVEKGIRGGISQCSKRYAKANNKYLPDYDVMKPSSYIMYLDVNNLYGHAMMNSLPLNGFKWCDTADLAETINTPDDSPIGYILEVDLHYPKELHGKHKDYPLCAETRSAPYSKHKKLLLTLYDKEKYVIHYKMLKMVLLQGLKVTCIHRILQFNQSAWLAPYIAFNTEQRTKATNEFEKNLYKLMSNAVYGKTMENLRKRVDINLKTEWEGRYGARALISHPTFKRRTIFDEELVAIEMHKTQILMNKPIIIGMAILDISKVVMLDFHYNYMKPKYGVNCEVLYTDTDSFVYEIFCNDFYQDIKDDISKYDTSDYPPNNVYGIELKNKKVPGLMKDEANGKCITEFVGLRSKMYSIRIAGKDAIKKSKGVKKYVLTNKITFDDYLACITNNCTYNATQNSIRSIRHMVFTIEQNKISLSPFDDKRRILLEVNPNISAIQTLPWGHYSLQE